MRKQYPIEIAEFNHSTIQTIARLIRATHMRKLGSANTDPTGNCHPDWDITLYEMNNAGHLRFIIGTNADCVLDGEEGFDEMAALCLGEAPLLRRGGRRG